MGKFVRYKFSKYKSYLLVLSISLYTLFSSEVARQFQLLNFGISELPIDTFVILCAILFVGLCYADTVYQYVQMELSLKIRLNEEAYLAIIFRRSIKTMAVLIFLQLILNELVMTTLMLVRTVLMHTLYYATFMILIRMRKYLANSISVILMIFTCIVYIFRIVIVMIG